MNEEDKEKRLLYNWLESGKHLPEQIRDFHDQKDLFKSMHYLYRDNEGAEDKPNWQDGQIYVIDWFLWFMASRGYALQRSRKNLKFKPMPEWRKLIQHIVEK